MSTMKIDLDVALEQFAKRVTGNNKRIRVNNAHLPAGSPMYYYCKYCGAPTDEMSEGNWRQPLRVCKPCEVLEAHGLV